MKTEVWKYSAYNNFLAEFQLHGLFFLLRKMSTKLEKLEKFKWEK